MCLVISVAVLIAHQVIVSFISDQFFKKFRNESIDFAFMISILNIFFFLCAKETESMGVNKESIKRLWNRTTETVEKVWTSFRFKAAKLAEKVCLPMHQASVSFQMPKKNVLCDSY